MAFSLARRNLGGLAALLAAPLALGQVTLNADRAGGDIARFADPDLGNDQCAARCESNAQCQAWVLVKDGSQGGVNVCYLKGTVAMAAPNRCCDTGVKVGPVLRPASGPSLPQRQLKGGIGMGPAQAGLPGGAVQGVQGSLDRAQAAEGGFGGSAPVQGQGPGQRGAPGQSGGQSQAGNGGFGGFGGAGPGNRNGAGRPGGRQQGMGGGFGGGSAPGGGQGQGPDHRNGGGFSSGSGRAGGGQAGRSDGGSGPAAGSSGAPGGTGSPWNQPGSGSSSGSPWNQPGSEGGGNAGSPQGTGSAGNQGWGPEGSPVRLVEGSNVSIEYTEMTEQQRDEKESTRIDAGPDKPKDKEDRPNPDSSRGSTPTPDGIGGGGGNSRAGFAGGNRTTPTDSSGSAGGLAGGSGRSGARLQGGGFVDPQGKVNRVVNPGSHAGQESDEGTNDWRPPPVIP